VCIVAVCTYVRGVQAQVVDVLQLPANHIIGDGQGLDDRLVRVPDTTGDSVDDYLVGIPEARGGEGAIGVVPGPLPPQVRVEHVVWAITAPESNDYGEVQLLGRRLMDVCDFNGDGRREVYVRAQRVRTDSTVTTSLILFDSVSLSIVVEALDCPEEQQLWAMLHRDCRPEYLAAVQPFVPFSLDLPRLPLCPTCSGGPPGTSSPGSGGSSSNTTSVGSGSLRGSGTSGGQASRAWNTGIEVGRWYTQIPEMTLSRLATAVVIAAEARAFARALAPEDSSLQNAARHAYWQAMTTRELGADIAQQIGDIHEEGQSDPAQPLPIRRDSWIDQYNNARAREIAAQCAGCTAEELAHRLGQGLYDGTFITNPCDPRIPPELRDCDGDGIPASEDDCDIPPGAQGTVQGIARADVNGDGVVTILDALDVLYAVGTQDTTKEQTGDCWVWIDDVEAVLELIE
jgi:hypothetical protein